MTAALASAARYYSRGFPARGRVTAQRDVCAPDVVTLRHRLPVRSLLPGSGYGEEPGAVGRPGGVWPGRPGEAGGLGGRQPEGGEAGRAGLAAADWDGRVTKGNQQVSVADVAGVHGAAGVVPGAGQLDVAGECVADGGGPELGEGGQGGVPADAVPAPGLGLVPAERVLARFERFLYRPAAPGDCDEIRHGGRPARGAQHG